MMTETYASKKGIRYKTCGVCDAQLVRNVCLNCGSRAPSYDDLVDELKRTRQELRDARAENESLRAKHEPTDGDIISDHAENAASEDIAEYERLHGSLEGCEDQPEENHGWWSSLEDELGHAPTPDEQDKWLDAYTAKMREFICD